MIKVIYSIVLGVLLAMFLGLGVSTFYPEPEFNDEPIYTEFEEPSPEKQIEYRQNYDQYREKEEAYNRNVSVIALVGAVLYLVGSIQFQNKAKVIADGVMLGSLFTLFYSITRGIGSNNDQYVFLLVAASIGLVVYVGYKKFIEE